MSTRIYIFFRFVKYHSLSIIIINYKGGIAHVPNVLSVLQTHGIANLCSAETILCCYY